MAVGTRDAFKGSAQRLGIAWDAREILAVSSLLVAALLVRVFLSQIQGLAGDAQYYVKWGASLTHHLTDFYTVNPDDNYPPLINLVYAVVDHLYTFLMRALGDPNPSLNLFASRRAAVFMRLPFILSDIGITATLYILARRVTSMRWALICAALFAFSPAVILDGTLWAQSDSMLAFSLLLATIFAMDRKSTWAGIMLGFGICLKLFPVLYAPLLLVYLLRTDGWRSVVRFCAGAGSTVLLICLPFLLPPHPQLIVMLSNLKAAFAANPYASVSAYNLWWMLGIEHANSAVHRVGPISFSDVGWLLFGVVAFITLLGLWRRQTPEALFLGMGITAVAYFDLTTGQHERYIYPAIVLFLAAAFYWRRHLLLFLVTSIAMFLDLGTTIIWNSGFTRPGVNVSALNAFLSANPNIYVAISMVDMVLLIAALRLFQRCVREAEDASDAANPVSAAVAIVP